MTIKTIDKVKEVMMQQLKDLRFEESNEIRFKSRKDLKDCWKRIEDDIEINWVLTKGDEKDTYLIMAYKDVEDDIMAISLVGSYVDLLMKEKEEKDYIKTFIYYTIEKIEKSFENKE